jgi:hypothetical protein
MDPSNSNLERGFVLVGLQTFVVELDGTHGLVLLDGYFDQFQVQNDHVLVFHG